jgi:LPXTG-site transpeptidase (sortase) family protein
MDKSNLKYIFLRTISNFLIFGAIVIVILTFGPWAVKNIIFYAMKARGVSYQIGNVSDRENNSLIKSLLEKKTLYISPRKSDFSLLIPRIGLTVPVVKNVSMSNRGEYVDALKHGVAHASGSVLPGQNGNSYYFAHSSLDFWELGPYATSFNLLNKLIPGDEIYVYLDNQRFVYKVLQTEIVKGWDTVPYYRNFVRPMLTLQTCDPPGTTLNRFLVLAELVP